MTRVNIKKLLDTLSGSKMYVNILEQVWSGVTVFEDFLQFLEFLAKVVEPVHDKTYNKTW